MQGKKDFLLIQNPVAGKEKNHRWVEVLIKNLEDKAYSYDLVETRYPSHATEIAFEKAADYGAVIAMGGDGTVHEVAQGVLRNGGGVLGILPIGNGNDYYRNFDSKVSPKTAINKILEGKISLLDVGRDGEDRYILNIASIGLDSYTNLIQKKIRAYAPKTLGYVLALIYAIATYKKSLVKIKLDDRSFTSNNVLFCFGGGKTYGGGIGIMPWAELDDGYFHVVNIVDISWPMLYIIVPSIIFGLHTKFKKYVKVCKAKRIGLEGPDMVLNIDGEIFNVDKLEVELLARKFKVIV